MTAQQILLACVEIGAFGFTILYAVCNTILILVGFGPSRARVRALAHSDLDLMASADTCPPIAVLVPAYNEEVGIVEAVCAFVELDYPALEIVVVNDGSKDGTLDALRRTWGLVRRDVTFRGELDTAPVRAVYEATRSIPERVLRLVVVDKENGGRADALNCGINVCRAPYFITVDGDSILDPLALKHIMRMIQDDPTIQAAGGQIGIVNASPVDHGRVVRRVVSASYLPLCQTLEYVRSFTTARSGFSRFNALLILSGAFLLTRRDIALSLGGFLTGRVRSKLLDEYAGRGNGTVGEDMELIVRLHRHERENGRKARVVHSALPVCWTEVPSTWAVLGRQRRRWHRGFLEILRYHRTMLFDPAYGRIGLVSFPFVALFEGLGPYLEAAGYVLLPILLVAGWIEPGRAILLAAVALGVGMLHSMVAVLCATWLEPVVPAGSRMRSLLGVDRWRDRMLLIAACVLSELGYRQATVFWRLQGTWEFLRGTGSWGAMDRKGFRASRASAAAAIGAFVLLSAAPALANEVSLREIVPPTRETYAMFGSEHREGRTPGAWFESATKWEERSAVRTLAGWFGMYGFSRDAGRDLGGIVGLAASLPQRAGASIELRAAPDAMVSARAAVALEGEASVKRPFSGTALVRWSSFRDATVAELAPGAIAYLPHDFWVAGKLHWTHTRFDVGSDDDVLGWSATISAPIGRIETRALVSSSGESYIAGVAPEPSRIRANVVGALVRVPWGASWGLETGATARFPERGEDDVTIHAGLRRRW